MFIQRENNLLKEEVSLKSKIRFGYVCVVQFFVIPVFYFDQSSAYLFMFS